MTHASLLGAWKMTHASLLRREACKNLQLLKVETDQTEEAKDVPPPPVPPPVGRFVNVDALQTAGYNVVKKFEFIGELRILLIEKDGFSTVAVCNQGSKQAQVPKNRCLVGAGLMSCVPQAEAGKYGSGPQLDWSVEGSADKILVLFNENEAGQPSLLGGYVYPVRKHRMLSWTFVQFHVGNIFGNVQTHCRFLWPANLRS